MSDFYDEQWYTDRWLSMPSVMRKLAADTIRKALKKEDIKLIKRKHAEHGHDWIHHLIDVRPEDVHPDDVFTKTMVELGNVTMSAHHGFGTAIRNLLRDEEYGAGIKDEDLPAAPYEDGQTHQNWDDFYVAAIEAACGLREV